MFATSRISQITSTRPVVILSFVLLIGVFSACESPVEPDTVQHSAREIRTSSMISTESVSTMNAEGETIVVESDGTMRAFMPGEEGIEITNSGAKRIDMVVTGSATYETGTVPELRLNVRQTRDGEISGKGVVTFYSFISLKEHTTEFVATCINPISGWGRTNYGVTMELAEPYFPFNNGVSYRYAVVSITEEGDLDPIQLLRNTDGCGGSISLFGGPDLETGNIQVLALGQ